VHRDLEPAPHRRRVEPLLAALILVQTLGAGQQLVLDARTPALSVAAVLV
jgi:hypothetical protein